MQLTINAGVGVVAAIDLAIIGMPGSLLFGVVTALLRFVPYVGAWIAALMAMVMAAALSPGWWMTAGTAGLFFVHRILTHCWTGSDGSFLRGHQHAGRNVGS